jgi:hypothetical protein
MFCTDRTQSCLEVRSSPEGGGKKNGVKVFFVVNLIDLHQKIAYMIWD